MCDLLKKKCKQSFSAAWLSDDRYKSWIRKVPSNKNLFHCIICNKNFSCNTHVSRHADSTSHKNNMQKRTSIYSSNEICLEQNMSNTYKFQPQWLEIEQFQPWLHEASHNEQLFFCFFCENYMYAKLAIIYRHAGSAAHIEIVNKKNKKQTKMLI